MIDPVEITARLSANIAELRNAAANLYYVSWTWGQCADLADDFEALLERVRVLEAQKQAALELHQPFEWSFGFGPVKSCRHCASLGADEALSAWPCATFRALGGEETT